MKLVESFMLEFGKGIVVHLIEFFCVEYDIYTLLNL